MHMVFKCYIFFILFTSKALATPRKNLNEPHGGSAPQVENHWRREQIFAWCSSMAEKIFS